jgi:hypothetical protein
MLSEHNMHRNKPFITNDTAQGLPVNVMGHQPETLIICMAVDMAVDMAEDTVMIMMTMGTGALAGAAVDATEGPGPYLSWVPLLVAFCWVTYCFDMIRF